VPGFERFLSASVAGSGQSAREVEQAQAWRREEVERVAGGVSLVPEQKGQQVKSIPPADKASSTRTAQCLSLGQTPAVPLTPAKRQALRHEPEGLPLPAPLSPTIAEDGSLA